MTEADYTPIPMPTYDDLVDGGFRNAEMIDRLQRKIERLRAALHSIEYLDVAGYDTDTEAAAAMANIAHWALNEQTGD